MTQQTTLSRVSPALRAIESSAPCAGSETIALSAHECPLGVTARTCRHTFMFFVSTRNMSVHPANPTACSLTVVRTFTSCNRGPGQVVHTAGRAMAAAASPRMLPHAVPGPRLAARDFFRRQVKNLRWPSFSVPAGKCNGSKPPVLPLSWLTMRSDKCAYGGVTLVHPVCTEGCSKASRLHGRSSTMRPIAVINSASFPLGRCSTTPAPSGADGPLAS
jgi:hypothetical protein